MMNPLTVLHSFFSSEREHCGRLSERVASVLILYRNLISAGTPSGIAEGVL